MRAAYELLRIAVPILGAAVPRPGKVHFRACSRWPTFGEYVLSEPPAASRQTPGTRHSGGRRNPGHQHSIYANPRIKSFDVLLRTMAHEMCHLALAQSGRKGAFDHGPEFNALASRVCRGMRWKRKGF